MGRLLILGFYDRANLGDEMFKETIPLLVPDWVCTFVATDDYVDDGTQWDGIICGGGDIFNDYFLTKIERITSKVSCPVYLLGVGVPYESMLNSPRVRLFDHIFLRERTDLSSFGQVLGSQWVHVLPDLGFLKEPRLWTGQHSKEIGVFPATPCLRDPGHWEALLEQIRQIPDGYTIRIIPFNSSNNSSENDGEACRRLKEAFPQAIVDHRNWSVDELLDSMSGLAASVCVRFHSHIFSTVAGCPFVSVATSRKVRLYTEEHRIPQLTMSALLSRRESLSQLLFSIAQHNKELLTTRQINNLLLEGSRRPRRSQLSTEEIYRSTRKHLFRLTGYDPESKSTEHSITQSAASKVAAKMCWMLTGSPTSKYLWGTCENLLQKPWELRGMIEWIANDRRRQPSVGLQLKLFDQNDLRGYHRAGWEYVMSHLGSLQEDTGIVCDGFVDRTFLWGRWVLSDAGVIPYTCQWIGFVHHTPNTEYTDNNCEVMIASKEFQQSLPTCKALICLSDYLAQWFRQRFPELNVISLKHPTVFVKHQWSRFDRLLHVGAWYRNPFSFYRVNSPKPKVSLKGKDMDAYFLPGRCTLNYDEVLKPDMRNKWLYFCAQWLREQRPLPTDLLITFEGGQVSVSPDLPSIEGSLKEMLNSVSVVDKVSNEEYDRLLSTSVVFLNLVDASAVNTVIECIVRNTPLVINRHPALEQYLGRDYPLFYETIDQVNALLSAESVGRAHQYLKELDKEDLTIDAFTESVREIIAM